MLQYNAKIVIVYNAESGFLNAIIHGIHKVLRPETYPCSLCALTYGLVSMRTEWRQFLEGLPFETVFHHTDDFAIAYPDETHNFPVILLERKMSAPEVLVSASDLDELPALIGLTALVRERLVEKIGSRFLAS